MSLILLTAPAVEPLSLDETRDFLRVEHHDDDEVIAALIAGSRIHVEAQTRRALITQSWRISADGQPENGRLAIVPAPGRVTAGIELDVTAGYGDSALAVPLRQAIRLLVAHWYDNRGLVTTGRNYSPLPATVAALIAPYRMLSL